MTWGNIRKLQSQQEQARGTEAGYARVQFDQLVYCAGEAAPLEPVFFGRAFDSPPFFTYSAVGKNEVPLFENNCSDPRYSGDANVRQSGLTIGVREWIRDERGSYIGAYLWYKMNKVEIQRGPGKGLIQWTYLEDTTYALVPDCAGPGDLLALFLFGDSTLGLTSDEWGPLYVYVASTDNQTTYPLRTAQWTIYGAIHAVSSVGGGSGGYPGTVYKYGAVYWKLWDNDPAIIPLTTDVATTYDYAACGLIRGMTNDINSVQSSGAYINAGVPFLAGSSTLDVATEESVMITVHWNTGYGSDLVNSSSTWGATHLYPGPKASDLMSIDYVLLSDTTNSLQTHWSVPGRAGYSYTPDGVNQNSYWSLAIRVL